MNETNYNNQAEKFITNPQRLLEFIWFMNHTSFEKDEIDYLINKFNISEDLINYIKNTIRKTPTWIIRLANGINNDYTGYSLGFKDYIDKKAGFNKICGNCIFFDKDNEWCNKGNGSYTTADLWRLCSTKD